MSWSQNIVKYGATSLSRPGRFSQIWNSSSSFGPVGVEEREHLRVHHSGPGGQPLHVAHPEAGRGAERVRVIDVAGADDGHRLEAAVRVLREARHHVAVIHPPAVLALEVLPDVVARQRRVGPQPVVAPRVVIDVVDAEEERIGRLPS